MADVLPIPSQPMTARQAADLTRALDQLRGAIEALGPGRDPAAFAPPPPKVYLLTWRDILAALGMKNNRANRRAVGRLNDFYAGPIYLPGRGRQPEVPRPALLGWWEGLEAVIRQKRQGQLDAAATVASRHDFGRTGEAVPDLAGGVRAAA